MSATNHRPAARLGCEPLEQRENPAGNVAVVMGNGVVLAAGDAADNAVSIQQNALGDIWMIGLNGTTINGFPALFVGRGLLNTIHVQLNEGNDAVEVVGLWVWNEIVILGGAGNDTIRLAAVTGLNIGVDGGLGNDVVTTQGVVARANAFITGNDGFDTIVFRGVTAPFRVVAGFEQVA